MTDGAVSDVATTDIVTLGRLVEEVAGAWARDVSEFWGEVANVMAGRLSASAAATEQRARELIAVAHARFEERFPPGLDSSATQAAIERVVDGRSADDYPAVLTRPCPACGTDALVDGYVALANPPTPHVVGPDMELDFSDVDVEFWPESFACLACGLKLKADELRVTRLGTREVLDNVDPSDYWDEGAVSYE